MELFKGYIRTKDKQPLEKIKGRRKFATLDDVRESPEYAGIIADGVVLIDVDDSDMAETMMRIVEGEQLDCMVYQTTRGRHFYFANNNLITKCGTHKTLANGLEADIKVGGHNAYAIVKFGGKERFCEWDCDELQEAPKWLVPIRGSVKFAGMEPGEGRNQALYNYILTLTSAGFSKDEARECLRIINSYVLAEPLSDDELATISRDEAFPEQLFFNGKQFIHERFEEYFRNEHKIKRINGQLHIWRDGMYVSGYRYIEAAMRTHIPSIRATQRAEVLKDLETSCLDDVQPSPANLIAFANGIVDISTGEIREATPDDIIVNKIPWDYDPEAYSEIADRTLDNLACHDAQVRALLEECIGYCFYRRNELSKSFLLTGDKNNGKSTFLGMVQDVLGEQNISGLDIGELDERFSVAMMAGKLANIGDDISDEFIQGRAVSALKKIVSGNLIKAELKGQDAFMFKPYVKLLFSANDIPRIRDRTGAVIRRLVIIPFDATFTKDDPDYDPYIAYKLKSPEVMRYLIRIGIQGLQRVLDNQGFTDSDKVKNAIGDYEVTNNPVLLFLQEIEETDILHHSTKEVHRRYDVFCAENGFGGMSLISFVKTINKRLGYTTRRVRVSGKLESIFERGDAI